MTEQLAVAVLGANGRMGAEAVAAVEAAADLKLVAALGRNDSLDTLVDAGARIVVDLTVPESTEANVRFAVEHGMHAVVGTTGWDADKLGRLEELLAGQAGVGVLIAPNFALGSVLASAFAAKASRYFESVEIIELHHPEKVDAPSGTAVRTAQLISAERAAAGLPASPDATTSELRRRARLRGRRRPRPQRPAPRPRGAPGSPAGRPGGAADPPARLLRPCLVYARRAAGCAQHCLPSGPHRGPGRLPGPGALSAVANVLTAFKANRTKIWVGAVTLLLVFYLVVSFQRAVLLMTDANPVAKAIGVAYLLLPVIGAWALVRELLFGARTERLAKILEAEGGLPVDNLPRTPAGRIIREAADLEFEKYRAETEAAPEDWRSWFRLSCAYDAAGDRKRARASMRDAVRLYRTGSRQA